MLAYFAAFDDAGVFICKRCKPSRPPTASGYAGSLYFNRDRDRINRVASGIQRSNGIVNVGAVLVDRTAQR